MHLVMDRGTIWTAGNVIESDEWRCDVGPFQERADAVLTLLVLKTNRLDELVGFYETLGIAFGEEQHGNGPRHYAGKLGDLVLELYPASPDDHVDSTTRLGFVVTNLDDVVRNLQWINAPVVKPPQSTDRGYRAVVRDPDGRAVELYQR
jgi:predicted enzyme related to lactoylglutathione lyase